MEHSLKAFGKKCFFHVLCAPRKKQIYLDPMAFFQKIGCLFRFERKVVFPRTNFYLQYLCFGKVSLRLVLFLLFVLVLSKVHYLRNRWSGIRRDFYEVQTQFLCFFERVFARHNAEVAFFCVNHAQLCGTDLVIDPCSVVPVISYRHLVIERWWRILFPPFSTGQSIAGFLVSRKPPLCPQIQGLDFIEMFSIICQEVRRVRYHSAQPMGAHMDEMHEETQCLSA